MNTTRRMKQPAVYDLYDNPELATLAALDQVLPLAVDALCAADESLTDGDYTPKRGIETAVLVHGRSILTLAEALQSSLADYQRSVRRKSEDNIPF